MAGPAVGRVAPGPDDPAGDRRGQLATRLRRAGDRPGAGRPLQGGLPLPRRGGFVSLLLAFGAGGILARPRRLSAAARRPARPACRADVRLGGMRRRRAAPRRSPRPRPVVLAGSGALAICRSSAAASLLLLRLCRGQLRRLGLHRCRRGTEPGLLLAQRHRVLAELPRQAAQHQHATQRLLRLAPAPPAASRPGTATAARSAAAAAASSRPARPGSPRA